MAKDGKAHRIVGPFAAMLILVESAGPRKKGRTVDEPNRETSIGHTGEQKPHHTSPWQVSEFNGVANAVLRAFQRFQIGWQHKMHISTPFRAEGSAPATSAKPPVLARGKISDATKRTRKPPMPPPPVATHVRNRMSLERDRAVDVDQLDGPVCR